MAGAVGFPDFQRTVNWDGAEFGAEAQAYNNTFPLGPIYVGQFARLLCYFKPVAGSLQAVTIAWWADQAQTKQLGVESITLDPSIGQPWMGTIDNHGPWVTMLFGVQGSGAATITARCVPTNRQPMRGSPYIEPACVSVSSLPVPAGGFTPVEFPTYYAGGPALIYASAGSASIGIGLYLLDAAFNEFEFYSLAVGNGAVVQQASLILPQGAWRWQASNNGGVNGTVDLTIIPSPTGAAGG